MKPISRRRFIEGTGLGVVSAATLPSLAPILEAAPQAAAPPAPRTKIRLSVNGAARDIEVEDRWTLAETLRDHLNLTGTKIGCDRGECGACTVMLDGRNVYSCSYLAVWADGKQIQTVEGLAQGEKLDPLQEAFIEHDGPQCGFCTSGQLMSAKVLLNRNPNPTPEQVRHALAGNLCRCSNYNNYVQSVMAASKGQKNA